jgi:N-acetylmuramoyl-L-alanine amidase
MKIIKHILCNNNHQPVNYRPTPNQGVIYTPLFLVMHYTASTRAAGTVSWFLDISARVSAHLLIDRDGSIIQFAPFNIVTWHAGVSKWNGLNGLNQYAIGIELVNGGKLNKTGDRWICPVDKQTVASNEVLIAKHKNDTVEAAWHDYTPAQMQTAEEIASLLVKTYKLKDVIGHDDIAPFRKNDPGPAFPMNNFRTKVMGTKDETLDTYFTNTLVNIRRGPGTYFEIITEPLPLNTKVQILKGEGNWRFVEVFNTVHGVNDLEGWVSAKYLVKK